MDSKRLVQIAETALSDVKGQSILSLNVQDLTEITDYMVIATGRSSIHVKALCDEVVKQVRQAGARIIGVEGKSQAEWVLVDIGDVVVHIMLAPVRALYRLEELWSFQHMADVTAESGATESATAGITGE